MLDDLFKSRIVGSDIAGFSGALLPALPDGLSYVAVPQDGATASQSDYFKSIMMTGLKRDFLDFWISRGNDIIDFYLDQHLLLHAMNFASVPPIKSNWVENGNSVVEATWTPTDVTDGVITCQWSTGQVDPHHIVDQFFNDNPEWEGAGSEEGRLISTAVEGKAKWGSITFSAPSLMQNHGPVRVKRFEYPASNPTANGATFKIHTDSNIGSTFLDTMPGESGTITVHYQSWSFRFYPGWHAPIRIDPLFCTKQYFSTDNFSSEHVIYEGRFRPWEPSKRWLQVFRHLVADPQTGIDVTATVTPLMKITHTGANGYQTKVDLSSTGWGAETLGVVFVAHAESSSDDAIAAGCQQRCKHSRKDHTGSITTNDGFFCELAATASGFGSYKKNCMLKNACDSYEDGLSSSANDNRFLEQIVGSAVPLYDEQPYPGIPFAWLRRNGPAGLAAFFMTRFDLPTLYESLRYAGGQPDWAPYEVGDDGDGNATFDVLDGLEQGLLDGLIRSTAWTAKDAGFLLADKNDAYDAMAVENSSAVDQYYYTLLEKYGAYQRCGGKSWHFVCRVPTEGYVYENRVKITKGSPGWNANFVAVEDEEDVVYRYLVEFDKNIDLYNKDRDVHGGLKTTVEIVAQTSLGGGMYRLETKNKVVRCMSLISAGENLATEFLMGGTCVRPLNAETLNNKYAWVSRRGNLRSQCIQPGDCIYNDTLGFRMPVKAMTPFGGSAQTQIPDDNIHDVTLSRPYHFIEFDTDTEALQSITITRNSGATTLTGEEGIDYHKTFEKDNYLYYEKTYEGQRGVVLEFSTLQTTAMSEDYELSYTVVTDADTYTGTIDLAADWNSDCIYTMTNANHDYQSVEGVKIHWQDTFGNFQEITLSENTTATNPSEIGFNEYVLTQVGAREWKFHFATNLFGASATIRLVMDSWYGSEAQFYAANIYPLHSTSMPAQRAPEDLKYGDTIEIVDEEGLIVATGFSFVGKTVEVRTDPVAHWRDTGITVEARIDDPDATPINGSSFAWFGAEGRMYFEDGVLDGASSLWLTIPAADRNCMMKEAALANILAAEKALMNG